MVAAWIRAETGVGPSMASGSQTWRGICALLPQAPMKRAMAMRVTGPNTPNSSWWKFAALTEMSIRLSVPRCAAARAMPMMRPVSPTRFTMNAFLPASEALFFLNQKPMSR